MTAPVPMAGSGDAYLPLCRLVEYSGLSLRTLRNHLVHPVRPLPHYRVGGRVLVKKSEFDAWALQFRVTASADGLQALVDDVVGGFR